MAGRHTARRGCRGGDVIPARRPTRARVATAAGAVALVAVLAATSALAPDRGGDVLAFAAAAAVGAVAAGVLTGAATLVSAGFILLAAQYAGSLLARDVHEAAPAALFAALFFAAAELAYWTLELRTRSAPEPGMTARRLAFVGVLAAGGLAVAAVVLAAAAGTPEPSLLLEAIGVASAVAVGLLVARIAPRTPQAEE